MDNQLRAAAGEMQNSENGRKSFNFQWLNNFDFQEIKKS